MAKLFAAAAPCILMLLRAAVALGSPALGAPEDFDGDGKTDIAVWRPSSGTWFITQSSNGQVVTQQWGQSGDVLVPGDYDGDGKSDLAVWRPSSGVWYITQSGNRQIVTYQWGESGDVPVPGDYDGDGKTDIAVWRPSSGTWYVIQSSNGQVVTYQWGQSGDVPVPGDYDGDGKTDIAVWRPSSGTWYIVQSSNSRVVTRQWGQSGDVPAHGDYDGDGKTDLAVWRPSSGTWYITQSSNNQVVSYQWGESGDVPVPGDYDGAGKTDIAVWRPSGGTWYIIQSSNGQVVAQQWGATTDIPVNGPAIGSDESLPPRSLTLFPTGGNNQTGQGGSPLPLPLVVTATNYGLNTPGVSITFSDDGAGGSFDPQSATTDASGAVYTTYTPPAVAEVISITATSPGYSPALFSETAVLASAQVLCAKTDLGGFPAEPPIQPEMSCASGSVTIGNFSPSEVWGKLDVLLCNVDGIPTTVGVPSCVGQDPVSTIVNLNYTNGQAVTQITASLVEELHTSQGFVLNYCSNNGAGNVDATGSSAQWSISQATADFWYGSNPPSNQCSVLLTDPHGMAVLVFVGFQTSVHCNDAGCDL